MDYTQWIIGLCVGIVGGRIVTPLFLAFLRKDFSDTGDTRELTGAPAWLTGLLEGVFFTVAVAFLLPGVMVAMMAWIAAKMAAHWNTRDEKDIIGKRFSALLGSMMNMLFATIGGLICGGHIAIA